ncbi:MAG: 16S rRNA (cytidine(1402)-2'-O)-methyltransferase [Candidatus Nealsonbacteria bacterium]|nr:16S rRNA (cytidine(1402)-2'-O)-methyltransferase [Candidatus Nealsonbacteria bacterium]
MSFLYIVATPIGNLEDISKRALRILSEVDLILCEDTRISKRLLDAYDIKKQTLSYHQHSKLNKTDYIVSLLESGKNLALVSDAGSPGISDPGNLLIGEVVKALGNKVKIVPVPGASALIAAASISGFPTDRFLFLGFPPVKNKRNKFFEEAINSKYPVILYESPYRILKTLAELKNMKKDLEVVVCRELTKSFETVYRGNIEKVIKDVQNDKIKGEFVIIVKE